MLVSIIKKLQLKWFGHFSKHNDSFPLANNRIHGRALGKMGRDRAPWKMGRGRSSVTWIQNSRDYTGISTIEEVTAAQDGTDWKKEL